MNNLMGGPGSIQQSQYVSATPQTRQREAHDLEPYDSMDVAMMKVPNAAIQQSQCNLGYEFLMSTVDPWNWAVGPPASAFDPVSMPQKGMLNLTWQTTADSVLNEQVPQSRGMIVHLPLLGWDAMWHMGIVPRGAVSTPTFVTPGMAIVQSVGPPLNLVQNTIAPGLVFNTITYNSELLLPFTESGRVLSITPNLSDQFKSARVYAGGLELYGNSIGTGSLIFNGRVSTAVINDTRDICQKGGLAYPADQLIQSARNNKECVLENNLFDGVVNVIGNDIGQNYQSTNVYDDDEINGAWTHSGDVGLTRVTAPVTVNNAGIGGFEGWTADWITPWDTDVLVSTQLCGAGGVAASGKFYTAANNASGHIGEADCFDIRYHLTYTAGLIGGPPAMGLSDNACGWYAVLNCVGMHVYAYIANAATGQVGYRTFTQYQSHPLKCAALAPGAQDHVFGMFEGKPGLGRNGMARASGAPNIDDPTGTLPGGKYIGTLMWYCINFGVLNGNTTGPNTLGSFTIAPRDYYVRARNVNSQGQTGPAHMTRYDGVGVGQEIRANAAICTQVVAESEISQYLKSGNMDIRTPANNNILNTLSALYGSSVLPSWKCSWKRSDWLEWRNKVTQQGCGGLAADILSKGTTESSLVASSQASGLFSAIGSGLGGFLDNLSGAAGRFRGRAAGPFGSGAGSFGSSAGSFGSSAGPFGSGAGSFGSSGGTYRR